MNVFKIPAKDHQVVHSVAADYISVFKILRNIKDLLLGKMLQTVYMLKNIEMKMKMKIKGVFF